MLFTLTVLSPVHGAPEVPAGLCINNLNCSDVDLTPANYNPGYYYSVGQSSAKDAFSELANLAEFKGGKRIYRWRDIEPVKGQYDFTIIEEDLNYLKSIGKQLWIQIFYTQFSGNGTPHVPSYMWNDPSYGCGPDYYGAYKRNTSGGGWIPCWWNKNVSDRLVALFTALGNRFNSEPNVEGITAGETAINTAAAKLVPTYNVQAVIDTYKAKALAAKKAFPNKIVFQYINFAPFDLAPFAEWLAQNKIGIGGPDVRLSSPFLLETVYPLYIKYHDQVVTGQDIQWGNYDEINKFLGRPNTPEELLLGAIEKTNPSYIFVHKRDPYFYQVNNGILPSIRKYGQPPAAQKYYENNNSLPTQ